MSRPIQVIPPGLLGFLQLKNSGKSPVEFPEVLQPVIELRDWYFEARAEQTIATVSVANGGSNFATFATPAIVPAEEYWAVLDFSAICPLLATTTVVSFVPAWRIVTGVSFSQFSVGVPQPLLAGTAAGRVGCAYMDRPFFVPPGAELGLRIMANEIAAGTVDYQAQFRFVRLPA